MTLFLSFALFGNVCTVEHIVGIIFFIVGLTAKSLRASSHMDHSKRHVPLKENNTVNDTNDGSAYSDVENV